MEQMTVLIAEDDEDLRHALVQGLELAGHRVAAFASAEGVLGSISRDFRGVLVSDLRMPGRDGLALMRDALEIDAALPVILISGHADVPIAVEAMRAGAYDFVEKPFATARLVAGVERALEKRRLVLENRALRERLDGSGGIETRLVGRAPAMERLRQELLMLAGTDADVLVVGETGVGKEVAARLLQDEGPRRGGPFVALNCGALPAEIIESELFGHEAGAFTGAQRQRIGKLEHAQGGTVFLDEIESMPLELQVKLLRVIESRSIERLGSNRVIPLDVRFVAATKSDLVRACDAGRFRRDLYYRLNVVTIRIPPLRERKEDIPLLFHHLAREARSRYRREIPEPDPVALVRLLAYDWPGNVRELRNAADRFVLGFGLDPAIGASGGGGEAGPSHAALSASGSLAERLHSIERVLIEDELRRHGGRLRPTYEALGISRKTLYDKMRRLEIQSADGLGDEGGGTDEARQGAAPG
ncbi:MAG: sigma-54-dependent Fis family transcriptional regulator [Burkholderiales bacterium]|nr:MAG: sigma-54-dependent Fis family transcriptional regulator [Burkholderiales bacterium]